MQLPVSEDLNIGYLSRLFDNTSNCYKFFWFQAILRKVDSLHTRFTFDELINEMIADAWYMVSEYHLRLGPMGVTDYLEDSVKYIFENYQVSSSEKREKIIAFLTSNKDSKLKEYKRILTKNVPYRLQVPFYDSIKIDKRTWYGSAETLIAEINLQKRLMYYFVSAMGLASVIEIDPLWADYLEKHREILLGWTKLKLIKYLQNKNPSVPGISDKIEVPKSRDIERVRKYWQLIIQLDPSLHDIYGDVELINEKLSVDHFVPWQYVAHDELWNLHPTTKSINSSKNNSLPDWTKYFEGLSSIEYRAYKMKDEYAAVKKEFDKCANYHLNNQEIRNQLYIDGLSQSEFQQRLGHIVRPVYESAMNCGFKQWSYDSDI